eukprot:646151-Pleurochrysis_carterae.AAC.2
MVELDTKDVREARKKFRGYGTQEARRGGKIDDGGEGEVGDNRLNEGKQELGNWEKARGTLGRWRESEIERAKEGERERGREGERERAREGERERARERESERAREREGAGERTSTARDKSRKSARGTNLPSERG